MLEFLCYFFPAFISLKVYNHLSGRELSIKNSIVYYGMFSVFNNLMTLSLIYIKHYNQVLTFNRIGITYCTKYLIISFIFSLINSFIYNFFEKNIKIRLEVKKNEKNTKNK